MVSAGCIHQLRCDSNTFAGLANTALGQIADAEIASDILDTDAPALVEE